MLKESNLVYSEGVVRIIEAGRTQGLLLGRIEGAIVTGLASVALFGAVSILALGRFRKEQQRNRDVMFDLLDELAREG